MVTPFMLIATWHGPPSATESAVNAPFCFLTQVPIQLHGSKRYIPMHLTLLPGSNAVWSAKRNRDRISEIINFIERNIIELDELAGEDDGGGEF